MRPLLLLWLLACGQNTTPATPGTPPSAGPATPATGGTPTFQPMPGAPALPDLSSKLEPGGCDNWQGNDIPGARGYFWAEYEVDGSKVTGVERWYLFANPTWKTKGGGDCIVEWRVSGETAPTGACGDCDAGIKGLGIINQSTTTCLDGLWKKENNANYGYDIKRSADGSATWYFSKSGKRVADGYHSGNKLTFVSDPKCNWF